MLATTDAPLRGKPNHNGAVHKVQAENDRLAYEHAVRQFLLKDWSGRKYAFTVPDSKQGKEIGNGRSVLKPSLMNRMQSVNLRPVGNFDQNA